MRWRNVIQILQRAGRFLPNLSGVTDDNGQHGVQNVNASSSQRFPCKDKGNQNRHPFLR
ncbi:hypothetical protein BANRA_05352 [Klebsiella pneumoniae]|nr:hypothetical protein BANRA_05352 [Klebsiella pneumoniae]